MPRSRKSPLHIAQIAQIRALAAPVRQDLMDCLEASGPCSVAQLARFLGRHADSLYYHLRRLERLGLVKRVPGRPSAETSARFDLSARHRRLEYQPGDPRNVTAVNRVVGAMLRSASRGFRRAFTPPMAVVRGRRRNLWAGRVKGWLSGEELEQVNALLGELVELMRQRRTRRLDGRRLHEFTFVLSPVVPRPEREA